MRDDEVLFRVAGRTVSERRLVDVLFLALSVLAALPLLRVRVPPLQDLPQHLAAISVLRHYPALGLGELFELDLFRTQYLAYYGLAWLLSYPFGVVLANKLLLVLALLTLPWTVAGLLSALGRDRRGALFVFPLLYNAHLMLGFLNFVAALPLLFGGLALAVRQRLAPSLGRGFWLAALLVVSFYTHVVPFGLLALGIAALLAEPSRAALARLAGVLAPATLALGWWLALAPAGQATLQASGAGLFRAGEAPTFTPTSRALAELGGWLTDVLTEPSDERLLVMWGVLFLWWLALSPLSSTSAVRAPDGARLTARLGWLCPLCVGLTFVTPASYDWIWPISARFPLLALLFAVLLLPPLPRRAAWALTLLLAVHGASGFHVVDRAFQRFEQQEVGAIDEALAQIPPGQRVLGLIFDRGSRHVRFSPFIHYVALYQAEKGGAVMFSFADFPQSPFRFREAARPPRVPPRWEWKPERVRPEAETYYRYVLVRGGGARVADPAVFDEVFRSSHWRVLRRKARLGSLR